MQKQEIGKSGKLENAGNQKKLEIIKNRKAEKIGNQKSRTSEKSWRSN